MTYRDRTMSISVSLSTLTFAYSPPAARPPAVELTPVAPTSPVATAGTPEPNTAAAESQAPLASAVAVAAQTVAGTGSAAKSSDDLEQALKSFTRVLAHALRAGLREGQDEGYGEGDGRSRSHGHGRGHAYGHDYQAFHQRHHHSRYNDLAPAADQLQALATRLQGAPTDPGPATAVPPAPPVTEAIPSAPTADTTLPAEVPTDVAVAAPTDNPAGAPAGRLGQRLLDAFAQLQTALGLTPSDNPSDQRNSLAAMLRDLAAQLAGPETEPAPKATGTLLQVTA